MADRIRNVYLVLSQKCNLTCSYCYAQGGDFGQESRLMDAATMKRALDRIAALADDTLVVSFFGGEPLLNFGLMKETVAYGNELARKQGIQLRYALTTNGTVMTDEILTFIKEHVPHVAVSLDGTALVNDRERQFRNGSRGVHDSVVETIGKLKEVGIRFGIRATVTERNAGELAVAAKYLARLGPESVRMAPAFRGEGWTDHAFGQLESSLCALEIDALEQIAAGGDPTTGEHLFKVLFNVVNGERRLHPCAAGMGVVAVAANGDVYPCDHFIGVEAFCMGNVDDEEWPAERFSSVCERMKRNSVEHRSRCRQCSVRHICGGECHVHSLLSQGDIDTASPQYCALAQGLSRQLLDKVITISGQPARAKRLRDYINGA